MDAVNYSLGQAFRNKKTKEVWIVTSIGCNKYFQNKKSRQVTPRLDSNIVEEITFLQEIESTTFLSYNEKKK